MEAHVASIAAFVIDELEAIKLQSERIVGDLFEEGSDHGPAVPSIPMAAPDTGTVNKQLSFYIFSVFLSTLFGLFLL